MNYSYLYSVPYTNIILIASCFIIFPFCLYKDVHKLKYYAVFLVLTNFLIFIVLISGSITTFIDPTYSPSKDKSNQMKGIHGSPVFCIAFECQYYFIALYSKLEKTNK